MLALGGTGRSAKPVSHLGARVPFTACGPSGAGCEKASRRRVFAHCKRTGGGKR